jgi:hypothetical protein
MNALIPQSHSAQKMIKEECDERLKMLPVYMMASMTMVLLDKGHVEVDEMQDILLEIENLYQGINGGYLDFKDIIYALEKEYGIKLHFVDNIKNKKPWLKDAEAHIHTHATIKPLSQTTLIENLETKQPLLKEFCKMHRLKNGDYYKATDYLKWVQNLPPSELMNIVQRSVLNV